MRTQTFTNRSPSDLADELAQAVNANLIPGFECIAKALSEPSFRARMWADGAGSVEELIIALNVAQVELEGMVICRRERAMLRRLIDEVTPMAHPTDTPHAEPDDPTRGKKALDSTGGTAS